MNPSRTALLSLLLLSPGLSAAATPPPAAPVASAAVHPTERTLRVEGEGEVKAAPDEAFLELALETQAPTAQAAAAANAQQMEKVIAALVQTGLARKELETRQYSVYPEYAPQPPNTPEQAPKIRGYRVSNTVRVHVRELARLGMMLDVGLKAGANRVDSVRFGLSKPEAARDAALRDAVVRARQSAQVLASALGVKLGPVLDASTVTEPQRSIPMARFAMASAESADTTTPLQPEEQTVQARVNLVFALEPAAAP